MSIVGHMVAVALGVCRYCEVDIELIAPGTWADSIGTVVCDGSSGTQAHEPQPELHAGDSRATRPGGEATTMVDWNRDPAFYFSDELDGLDTLRELGDELRQTREHAAHVMRYLQAAAVALYAQHQSQPQAMIRESGASREMIYKPLREAGLVGEVLAGDDRGAASGHERPARSNGLAHRRGHPGGEAYPD